MFLFTKVRLQMMLLFSCWSCGCDKYPVCEMWVWRSHTGNSL